MGIALTLHRDLNRRIYDEVASKLTLSQIAEVAMGTRRHGLRQREVDVVLHYWGV